MWLLPGHGQTVERFPVRTAQLGIQLKSFYSWIISLSFLFSGDANLDVRRKKLVVYECELHRDSQAFTHGQRTRLCSLIA
jgi:hypothetical protein